MQILNINTITSVPCKSIKWRNPQTERTHLLQFVGLGFVLVPVCVLPVGQTEGPHRHDAVNIVSNPGVRLILATGKKTSHRVLTKTQRKRLDHNISLQLKQCVDLQQIKDMLFLF